MTRVALTGGDYRARGQSAAAQTCLNLFPEALPQQTGEPIQFYHLPTPGLEAFAPAPVTGAVRGLFTASSGQVFAAIGQYLYQVQLTGNLTAVCVQIGQISNLTTPVRMQDNSIVLVVVDGIVGNGWYVTLNQYPVTLTAIDDPAWYGATSVAYLDTYLMFNRPGTQNWYVSPSNWDGNASGDDPFDGTYIASKSTYPDQLSMVAVSGQAIYLIGTQTTEIWYDAGTPDFPFGRVPGILINHGTQAPYSVDTGNGSVFWLGNDRQGKSVVWMGTGYEPQRISTHAIEAAISEYNVTSDAIGFFYQQDGHYFYELSFPTADVTWCYDATTQLWHQRASADVNGNQHVHRISCVTNAFGYIVAGDATTGALYLLSKDATNEIGMPIMRQRSFPHLVDDFRRVVYRSFTADVQVPSGSYIDPTVWRLGYSRDRVFRLTWTAPTAEIDLDWSDDRGLTFGSPVLLPLGSAVTPTALIGAFVETQTVQS